jgi:hypothetical protein
MAANENRVDIYTFDDVKQRRRIHGVYREGLKPNNSL